MAGFTARLEVGYKRRMSQERLIHFGSRTGKRELFFANMWQSVTEQV
jgi:hypothetical protein